MLLHPQVADGVAARHPMPRTRCTQMLPFHVAHGTPSELHADSLLNPGVPKHLRYEGNQTNMHLLSHLSLVNNLRRYSELLRHSGEAPVAVRRCETVEEVLREADVSAC
jgi:hypothetical protein